MRRSTVSRIRVGMAAAGFVAAGIGAAAQTAAPSAQQQPTFRGGVDLVTIRALVRDGKGRPVTTLDKAAGDVQAMCGATLDKGEHARLKLRDERRVTRQDAKLAVRAGNVDRIHSLRQHAALWCDDF